MVAVVKDPAIKLFGRTISLHEETSESMEYESRTVSKSLPGNCRNENLRTTEEAASLEPCKIEQPQTCKQKSFSSQAISNSKAHPEESDNSEEPKSSKRPDKIVPCPRCNSSDTKFCYFNNYNVNQPRHFCKSCQRYWTAGGTVRNVPVGAGRRRNKHLASQYRQLVASSDVEPATVVETSDLRKQLLSCDESTSSCTTSSPSEMVLKFGPDSPHCQSVPNLLSQSLRSGHSDVNLHNYSLSDPPQVTGLIPTNGCGSYPVPDGTAQSTPNIAVQFVPTSYWNYIPVWVAGSGNVSLAVSNGCVSPPFFSSGNGVQVLGKHSRDTSEGEMLSECMPSSKTRAIHDLGQA